MLKRLESWSEKWEKLENEIPGYTGKIVDVLTVLNLLEDIVMEVEDQSAIYKTQSK